MQLDLGFRVFRIQELSPVLWGFVTGWGGGGGIKARVVPFWVPQIIGAVL